MIKTSISLPAEQALFHLLETEQFKHPRARYDIHNKGKTLHIDIEAEDAVALKTAVSSLCRVITMYEKAKGI